ncbi:Ig-like domain-containing protein [Methanosphaera sp.]
MVLIGVSAVSAIDSSQMTTIENDESSIASSTITNVQDITNKTSENTNQDANTVSSNFSESKENTSLNTQQTIKSVKQSTNTSTMHASSITVENKTVSCNSSVQLVVKVVDKTTNVNASSGKVAFKINGKTVGYDNVVNGKAYYTYNTTGLTAKNYTISVVYGGNSYLSKSNATGYLTVITRNTQVVVSNKTIAYNNSVQLTATVTDSSTKNYVSGGKVAFKINGKTVGYDNVVNGKAYYTYNTTGLSVKNYTISVVYSGNSYLSKSNATGYLKIITRNTQMSISNKTVSKGELVQLTVTVIDNSTKNYVSGGKVAFKINGKTVGYDNVVDGKSYYNYNTSTLGLGNYTINASYSGSKIYTSAVSSKGVLTVTAPSFTYAEIKEAAVYLRNQYESDHILTKVTVGSTTMGVEDFLPIMIKLVNNINNGKVSSSVTYVDYNPITSQIDTITGGKLSLSEVITMGNKILNFYSTNNRPPTYATTTYGQLGYYNIIYTYLKIIDVSSSNYLPSTNKVYNWSVIHPTNITSRSIYITSDNIYNSAKDYAFMNSIKSILESKGFTVYIVGLGPNTHNTEIWAESLPENAVQLSIFGGSDAGVFYDMCTRSFMRKKSNRLLFIALYSATARNITNLGFLERAHDDNYSPDSFTGLANPDVYLKEHGYDYIYTTSATSIANALIDYING